MAKGWAESLAYFKIKRFVFFSRKKFRAKTSPFRRVRQSLIASLICLFRGMKQLPLHKVKGSTKRKEAKVQLRLYTSTWFLFKASSSSSSSFPAWKGRREAKYLLFLSPFDSSRNYWFLFVFSSSRTERRVFKLFDGQHHLLLLLVAICSKKLLFGVLTVFSCHPKPSPPPPEFNFCCFFFFSCDDRPHTGNQPEVVDRQVKRYAKENSNYLIKCGQPRQQPTTSSSLLTKSWVCCVALCYLISPWKSNRHHKKKNNSRTTTK